MLHVVWCMHGARLLPAIKTSTPYKLLIYRKCFMWSFACTELNYFPPLGRVLLTNCWPIGDNSCRVLRARSSTTSRHYNEHSLEIVDLSELLYVICCVHGARLLSAIRKSTPYKLLIYRSYFMSSVACTELNDFPPLERAFLTYSWSIRASTCPMLRAWSSTTSRNQHEHSLQSVDL